MLTNQDFEDNTYDPATFYTNDNYSDMTHLSTFQTTKLYTYHYGWCQHHHLENQQANLNDLFYVSSTILRNMQCLMFMLHPDDVVTFHIGLSVSEETLYPVKVPIEGESTIVALNFYLTYYSDQTIEMGCSSDTSYSRKGT